MVGERGSRGRILVVGAGYAGLTTAIELSRKNFEVEVIESASKLTTQGMFLLEEAGFCVLKALALPGPTD